MVLVCLWRLAACFLRFEVEVLYRSGFEVRSRRSETPNQKIIYRGLLRDSAEIFVSSMIWIHVCVHLLLFITLGVHSSALDVNLVANAISRLNVLRQNIPRDYKIPIDYMPKEKAGMCWVTLNVFYLENSLDKLENKFGNISSNKDDIRILIEILQALRIKMYSLEQIMGEYVCHYQNNAWKTEQYFDFVKDFLSAANTEETLDDCDPPPCPSTPAVTTIEPTTSTSTSTSTPTCQKGCSPHQITEEQGRCSTESWRSCTLHRNRRDCTPT